MRNFRDLKVWEKSHLLTLEIYRATAEFPRDALYGLTSQMRRSCASIPTNIAEGSGRHGNVELARFLHGLLNDPEHERLAGEVTEVKRMLTSFIRSLRAFSKQQDLKADA
jgi:hypothetical protein